MLRTIFRGMLVALIIFGIYSLVIYTIIKTGGAVA